jgi:hypothetical protein
MFSHTFYRNLENRLTETAEQKIEQMKNYIRWGLLSAVLSVGFLVLLYAIDKTWMVKFARISAYIIFFIFMFKGVSQVMPAGFSSIFRESWLIFVVGSSLFHLSLYTFMNYVDTGLQTLASQLAQSWLEGENQEGVAEVKVSTFREITFPIVASFIFPGTIWAGIVAVIKRKDSFID